MVGRNEETMYTGTLIEDLLKTVENTEKRFMEARSREEKLAYFYTASQFELTQYESTLSGVA
jgi:hypothetical protein